MRHADYAGARNSIDGEQFTFKDFRVQLQPAGVDDGVQAARDDQSAIADLARIGGGEPTWFMESLVTGRVAVTVCNHRPAQPNATIFNGDLCTLDGLTIIDAAAGCLGGTIGGYDVDAQLFSACRHLRVQGCAADKDGIKQAQSCRTKGFFHGLGQLHRSQRGVGTVAGEGLGAVGECGHIKTVGHIHTHRIRAREQRTNENLQASDVIGRHRQQPLSFTAEPLMCSGSRGDQVIHRQLCTFWRAGGTGSADNKCDGLINRLTCALRVPQD